MYNISETHPQLTQLAIKIENLHNSSTEMLKLMEDQIDAIISSNIIKIEKLSSMHDSLSVKYKIHEDEFINELKKIVGVLNANSKVRLLELKEIFPESSEMIENWQKLLSQNTKKLQQKNEQILEILEFALSRSSKLMRSLYSLHHEKNTHYIANGSKIDTMTGVAINQEI